MHEGRCRSGWLAGHDQIEFFHGIFLSGMTWRGVHIQIAEVNVAEAMWMLGWDIFILVL